MQSSNALFLSAAAGIGERICEDAVWSGDTCAWEGPLPTLIDGRWGSAIRMFGPDLYGGTSGIALFLARLHRHTGERRFADTAAGAARDAVSRLGDVPAPVRSGLYAGFGGIALAALAVGEALEDETWVETGLRVASVIGKLDAVTQSRDLLSGTAGAIALLVAVYRRFGRDQDLAAAVRLGRFLAGDANDDGDATSWATVGTASAPGAPDLTGLSHGAAGIGFALLELHAATGDPEFLSAADRAFRYEDRWFDERRGNWADVRALDADDRAPDGAYLIQWCYGAAGAGLARLRAFELLDDDQHRARAVAAVRTVADDLGAFPDNSQPNYSLCHGVCGNAELLMAAARVLDEPDWLRVAESAARQGIDRHGDGDSPWPSGGAGAQETPSLMWGLAGTGYFYLRLAEPETTPSVLLPTGL